MFGSLPGPAEKLPVRVLIPTRELSFEERGGLW
jgi:hypothetical protein